MPTPESVPNAAMSGSDRAPDAEAPLPSFLATAIAAAHGALPPSAVPARRAAIVTCMDARIVPCLQWAVDVGDVNVIRNAGGRVTDDVVRSLSVAHAAFGLRELVVIHHTGCAMNGIGEDAVSALVADACGDPVAAGAIRYGAAPDVLSGLTDAVSRLAVCTTLPKGMPIQAAILDVATGSLREIPELATAIGSVTDVTANRAARRGGDVAVG